MEFGAMEWKQFFGDDFLVSFLCPKFLCLFLPTNLCVHRVSAVTMQLADRRRLGGSRRGKPARSIRTSTFGSLFSEHIALRKMRAAAPFGRCEPPRRRRSYCIVTAQWTSFRKLSTAETRSTRRNRNRFPARTTKIFPTRPPPLVLAHSLEL